MALTFAARITRVIAPVLALAACARGGEVTQRSTGIVDDAGRAVHLERPATRIVSLAPAFTELLFAIGAGEHVVGRTRWDEYPPQVESIASVGDGLQPNVEAIVARRPDLVVFYQSPSNANAIAQLDALGIPSVSLHLDKLADFHRAVRVLAQLTGTVPAADSALAEFDAQLRNTSTAPTGPASPASPASPTSPTVLLLAWDNPPIVIGSGSFQSELVDLAGAQNVFADIEQPSAQVSIETIVARDPDAVVITGDAPPAFAQRPEWQVVRAIREHRFVTVSGTEFAWPSFRAPQAVRELRRSLAELGR